MPFFNHNIKYMENPPPPNEDFDYINFPVVEHFLWPQRIKGPQRIHVNYNLIHRSFFVDEESDEELTNARDQVQQTNNVQEASNIPQKTNVEEASNIPRESKVQEVSKISQESNIKVESSILQERNIKVESNIQLETNAERETNDEKQIDVPIKDPEIEKSGKKMHKKKKKHKERRHHKRHHKRDSSSDKERHSRRSEMSRSKKTYSSSDDERHSRRSEMSRSKKTYSSSDDERRYSKFEKDYSSDEEKYVKKPEKEIIERSHSFSSRWNECREENSRSRLSQHLVDRQKFSDDSTSDSDDSHSRRSSAKRRSVFAYSRSITPDWYSSQNDSEQDSREYGSTHENENHFSRTFYCEICQLQLNSELTFQSHMNGKKHQKTKNANSVPNVVESSMLPVSVPEESSRFDRIPSDVERVELSHVVSSIQGICDEVKNVLILLENVLEIHSSGETKYYCKLCDAPCAPSSIMPHILGFKHALRCVKQIAPYLYNEVKNYNRRKAESVYLRELIYHQKKYGRGKVRVFQDRPKSNPGIDTSPIDQPGPSWRNDAPISVTQEKKPVMKEVGASAPALFKFPSPADCLDTKSGDYRCSICDVHMNNDKTWKAHVIGKKHLKNIKKGPQGSVNSKFVKAPPDTISNLEKMLEEEYDPDFIFGLQYIRESQGEGGDQYNCFPCGSCCTSMDIISHLQSIRHKMTCLEKMNSDGKENDIIAIKALQVAEYYKEGIIDQECRRLLTEFGSGKPEVYIAKDPITGKAVKRL